MTARLRRLVTAFLPVFLVVTISAAPPALADDVATTEQARTFIVGLADKAVQSLTADGIDKMERRKRFRGLMLEYFAFKGIAKWVLGRYWRRATADERDEYLKLFEELMVVVYADRFAKYSGEKLEVGRSEVRGGTDILVHSVIQRPEGLKPVEVAWRLRQKDDTYKIVDVMVEGLSMGLTQQKEFSSVIRKNGGKVRGLLDELKKRLEANT
ncbi:MAG: ABC transporter substrate-binding protein [Magnetovibrio sp.]|nr:ABC transporter substrate-binding protein [Magnetovibrio sp.]